MRKIDCLAKLPVGLSLLLIAIGENPYAALKALWARLTGKRVRAKNILRRATAGHPCLYQIWQHRIEPMLVSRLGNLPTPASARMIVGIIADQTATIVGLLRTLATVQNQCQEVVFFYSEDCAIPSDHIPEWLSRCAWNEFNAFATDMALQNPSSTMVTLRCGDQLACTAVRAHAEAFGTAPGTVLCYGDQDRLGPSQARVEPWFKPDWNREHFLAQDYISAAFAVRLASVPPLRHSCTDLAQAICYSTALAHADACIAHLPLILTHCDQEQHRLDDASARQVIQDYLPQNSEISASRAGTRRIDRPLPKPLPLVSIIVPTRDRVDLLGQCVDGISKTDYPNIELIIVDNDSSDPSTIEYFASISREGAKVIPYPGPFNFADMNNVAAAEAQGSLLCFVNNDVEFIDAGWLKAMVRYAGQAEVGAVGAKLLYPNHNIQHAGVAIGLGGAAGHMHKHVADSSDAHHAEPQIAREVSAVTAACLLVSKDKFQQIGGFDQENFVVAFNDVDLCLKLLEAGYTNIYTPHAVAIHHESVSRGNDLEKVNFTRFSRELNSLQKRWNTAKAHDRNWSIHFNYACEQQTLFI